jgi:hemolysin activation/secretion protein
MRPITGSATSRLRTFSLQPEGEINSPLLPLISYSHLAPNEGVFLTPETPLLLAQNPSTPLLNPQSDPNRDRFLQPTPQPIPQPPQKEPTPLTPTPNTTPSPSPELPSTPILIQKIEVFGSTIFKPEEIEKLTRPLEGRSVTLQELRELAEKITELYLDRGYITSRAILPPQTLTGGLVKIQIIEGRLATVQIEGNKHLNASYISSRIRLGASVPLNPSKLEDQLRLLRLDPLLENVEASLRAGEKEGESILIVRIVEANRFGSSFSIDNYSPPSVGSERAGLYLRYRNLTGFGDEFSGNYYKALGDSDVLDFNYRIPVNAMNGTLQLRVAPNRNGIVLAPFDEFGISGKSKLYEISFRQPLTRSPIQEFAVSLGFSYQTNQTFLQGQGYPFGFGPDVNGMSKTSVIKFGQDYLRRDPQGAWALRSQFNFGTGLFDATVNTPPIPDGLFFSWLGQAQRVQRLSDSNLLILQADLQLTPNSLLPTQQFIIGGGQSLRGYRQNLRGGDNGFRFSIEDRITIERNTSGGATLQFAPFVDMGSVWNSQKNPNKILNPSFLVGIGFGILWEPINGLNVRLDYGIPLVPVKDRGQNAQDHGFYFSVIYTP